MQVLRVDVDGGAGIVAVRCGPHRVRYQVVQDFSDFSLILLPCCEGSSLVVPRLLVTLVL